MVTVSPLLHYMSAASGTDRVYPFTDVLYLSAPILDPSSSSSPASSYLTPYLESLLSLAPDAPRPLYTASYFPLDPAPAPSDLPANLLVTPSLPSQDKSKGMITALDEVVAVVEELFWEIVGDEGRKEGVEFFRKETSDEDDED